MCRIKTAEGSKLEVTMAALFRATRRLQAVTKNSTGLVGILVDPNARLNLIAAEKNLLEAVKVRHWCLKGGG